MKKKREGTPIAGPSHTLATKRAKVVCKKFPLNPGAGVKTFSSLPSEYVQRPIPSTTIPPSKIDSVSTIVDLDFDDENRERPPTSIYLSDSSVMDAGSDDESVTASDRAKIDSVPTFVELKSDDVPDRPPTYIGIDLSNMDADSDDASDRTNIDSVPTFVDFDLESDDVDLDRPPTYIDLEDSSVMDTNSDDASD